MARPIRDCSRKRWRCWHELQARCRAQHPPRGCIGHRNTAVARRFYAAAAVRFGDVIVADDDGVVVVPRLNAAAVAKAGLARQAGEDEKRKRLAAGELGLDMYGMRPALDKAGLRYIDDPE